MKRKVLAASIVGVSVVGLALAGVGIATGQCCGGGGPAVNPPRPTASPAARPNVGHAAELADALAQIDAAVAAVRAGRTDDALAFLAKARAAVAKTHKALVHGAPRTGFVNGKCPIMGGKIDPKNVPSSLVREFRGQKVAFCCAACPAAWDKLSDDQREAKLEAVGVAKPTPKPTPSAVNVRCPVMGARIDPKNVPGNLTREFRGHTVGFCCAGCPAAWDKLSDAQKEAKLRGVLPAGTGK